MEVCWRLVGKGGIGGLIRQRNTMSKRDLEALLGAFRSAASKEQLADMLTTLLSREEIEELSERMVAVQDVLAERARVIVPSEGFRSFYLARRPALGVLRDESQDPYSRSRGEAETDTESIENEGSA